LLRAAGAQRLLAGLGALTLGFNPLYFGLASSFMTDVPFTAVATASAVFLSLAIRDGRRPALWVGVALALWATLIRQIGVALLLAYAIGGTVRRGRGARYR